MSHNTGFDPVRYQLIYFSYTFLSETLVCGCVNVTHTHLWRLTCDLSVNQTENPPPPYHAPTSFIFGRSQRKVNFGRNPLLCHCHLMPLSHPFSSSHPSSAPTVASGANIAVCY